MTACNSNIFGTNLAAAEPETKASTVAKKAASMETKEIQVSAVVKANTEALAATTAENI